MNFFLKSLLKKQMKGVPEDQIDLVVDVMEKNPAFFQKIAEEIKAKTSTGMSQQDAAMQIMAVHGEELKRLMDK